MGAIVIDVMANRKQQLRAQLILATPVCQHKYATRLAADGGGPSPN
jgi:hypothetical protein